MDRKSGTGSSFKALLLKVSYCAFGGFPLPVVCYIVSVHVNGLQRLKSQSSLQREFLSHTLPPPATSPLESFVFFHDKMTSLFKTSALLTHLLSVDQIQQSRPANQSEQTGLWFQTGGEKRCCSTGSMSQERHYILIYT